MANRNAQLGEDPWDRSLSGRLPPASSTRFRWRDPPPRDVRRDVGPMGVLPLELIHAILQQLDLDSLRRLERVSWGMRRAVTGLPQLRAVAECARDTLRAIWAADVGRLIICSKLYAQLCRPTCFHCSFRPGEYLYLLACHRVCRMCLLGKMRYRPLRPAEAAKEFGMTASEVTRLPRLRVPKYSRKARGIRAGAWARRPVPKQRNTTGWHLVDREAALRHSLRVRRAMSGISEVAEWNVQRQVQVRELRARPVPASEMPSSSAPPPLKSEYAYSVSALFPWLDRSTQNVGRAVLCRACRFGGAPRAQWYHCMTAQGRRDHVARHGRIVDGEHVGTAVNRGKA
ncbi:Cyclin-like F-box [Cordyceps fumosorosea ARSEF 2679]|uniref:Cyclin-like F-box n=1 Tax=Cordyceps fumosorosea (strain ARSEF 2679) TaxID=1081104 RepID=A0A162K3L8_CORFA|nr:Cyclin-like F-box [Cordyceps fumosorosea ARSEF 2679]OAA52868.1 Cyclin-like F-box [Cordyceps fumosorosea ARSEF 2679]